MKIPDMTACCQLPPLMTVVQLSENVCMRLFLWMKNEI